MRPGLHPCSYLQESGFAHSSFTFGLESGVTRSAVARTKIPPGALIVQLQRALNYVQAEVGMGEDGTPCDVDDLGGADALTLIDSVQPEVCEKRRKQLWESKRGEGGAADDGPVNVNTEVAPQHVRVLSGHEGEVYACAWHPATNVLASGSGDSTARIWSLEAVSTTVGRTASTSVSYTTVVPRCIPCTPITKIRCRTSRVSTSLLLHATVYLFSPPRTFLATHISSQET